MDTPRVALAPSLDLLSVPSAAISTASTARWSYGVGGLVEDGLGQGLVDVADGVAHALAAVAVAAVAQLDGLELAGGGAGRTIARPKPPSSRWTSHSRVGLPLESSTSRATTSSMVAMGKAFLRGWSGWRRPGSISSRPIAPRDDPGNVDAGGATDEGPRPRAVPR
jgi:hypothetical protein